MWVERDREYLLLIFRSLKVFLRRGILFTLMISNVRSLRWSKVCICFKDGFILRCNTPGFWTINFLSDCAYCLGYD